MERTREKTARTRGLGDLTRERQHMGRQRRLSLKDHDKLDGFQQQLPIENKEPEKQ